MLHFEHNSICWLDDLSFINWLASEFIKLGRKSLALSNQTENELLLFMFSTFYWHFIQDGTMDTFTTGLSMQLLRYQPSKGAKFGTDDKISLAFPNPLPNSIKTCHYRERHLENLQVYIPIEYRWCFPNTSEF